MKHIKLIKDDHVLEQICGGFSKRVPIAIELTVAGKPVSIKALASNLVHCMASRVAMKLDGSLAKQKLY